MKSCRDCAHYRYNFVSTEVDGEVEWTECAVKPHVANLKHFPFESTKCDSFQRVFNPPLPSS